MATSKKRKWWLTKDKAGVALWRGKPTWKAYIPALGETACWCHGPRGWCVKSQFAPNELVALGNPQHGLRAGPRGIREVDVSVVPVKGGSRG